MNDFTFLDRYKIGVSHVPSADMHDADPVGDYFNLALYREITWLIPIKSTTGTATITVLAATDAAGSGAAAMAYKSRFVNRAGSPVDTVSALADRAAAGFATAAAADGVYAVQVTAESLAAGMSFVALKLTEVVNAATVGAVIALLGKPRFGGSQMPSAVS